MNHANHLMMLLYMSSLSRRKKKIYDPTIVQLDFCGIDTNIVCVLQEVITWLW